MRFICIDYHFEAAALIGEMVYHVRVRELPVSREPPFIIANGLIAEHEGLSS